MALALFVGVVALLVALRPTDGPYVAWAQPTILALYALGVVAGGVGVFHVVAGAPGEGPLRLVRTPLKLLLIAGAVVMIGVGEFVLHAALTFDGARGGDDGEHHRLDWD